MNLQISMNENNSEIIQKSVKEILSLMGFDCQVEIKTETIDDQESMVCNVLIEEDSNFIIGQHGTNLQSLQHIARLITRKKTDDPVKFILDVNSYRQQKNQDIIEQARELAKQALREKKSVAMRPMSAYERRLVHMEFSGSEDISTESIGEGEEKKIIIRPSSI
ncbi:MAG: spoIIIJ-associated protein [Candidatus Berkelbacteria bacterium Athens1014_28]|uniref:SpoIIIJ-associated protein n=1 Tax=Candidatus Berkelbacteria bacterium Athens1014_28 TaxID=2017145 RepID=A0A554LPU6_9BACT|nr:MAG: spoIIIJ-associated protein [Candidatus Berkelbacteria bacterium Athens1014_28]